MAGNTHESASLGRKIECDGKAWISKSSEDRWKWKRNSMSLNPFSMGCVVPQSRMAFGPFFKKNYFPL